MITEAEKRQQRAMALLELREAEENLAHLSRKAERLAAGLDALASSLREVAYANETGAAERKLLAFLGNRNDTETSNGKLVELVNDFLQSRELVANREISSRNLGV